MEDLEIGGGGGGGGGGVGGGASGVLAVVVDRIMSCFSCAKTIHIGEHQVAIRRQLAEGGFSFVYEVRDVGGNGRTYAMKKMLAQTTKQAQDIKREVRVHRAFRHPNILPLVADANIILPNGTEVFHMLLPMFARGSLQDHVLRWVTTAPIRALRT